MKDKENGGSKLTILLAYLLLHDNKNLVEEIDIHLSSQFLRALGAVMA